MYARPSYIAIRHYIEFLMQQELMDSDFGRVYLEGYEKARFSEHAPTEQEYLDIMKHLAAILNQMGYHLNQATTPTPSIHITSPANTNNHSNTTNNNNSSRRFNGSNESYSSGASGRSRQSTFSYRQHRSNSTYFSPNMRQQHSSDRFRHTPRRESIPGDDDVASLAQSVATWSSRSTHRYPGSGMNDHDDDDDDDEDYDENMRHIIYDRLMQSPS
jgi:hypothetical protein